jgi:hypothetical protein
VYILLTCANNKVSVNTLSVLFVLLPVTKSITLRLFRFNAYTIQYSSCLQPIKVFTLSTSTASCLTTINGLFTPFAIGLIRYIIVLVEIFNNLAMLRIPQPSFTISATQLFKH